MGHSISDMVKEQLSTEIPDLTPQVYKLRVLVDLAWGYVIQNEYEMLPDRFSWAFILMADLIDQIENDLEVLDRHARLSPEKLEAWKKEREAQEQPKQNVSKPKCKRKKRAA